MLTDGRIWLTEEGEEQKAFHVRDGQGIVSLPNAGIQTGIISGRSSSATVRRAIELRMRFSRQGVSTKLAALDKILAEAALSRSECGYIGDDTGDVEILERLGLAVAVAEAAEAAKQAAH